MIKFNKNNKNKFYNNKNNKIIMNLMIQINNKKM